MACDADDLDFHFENTKSAVRQSFARIYAALKARELKTLRQLEALRKQCQNQHQDTKRNCVQNIHIRYDIEPTLLDNEYVSPNDDHMYSYKTIEDLMKNDDNTQIEAIEAAAIQEVTKTETCVCSVNIRSEDIARKFRDMNAKSWIELCDENSHLKNNAIISDQHMVEDERSDSSDPELKKIDPTDDWLNTIKGQTEIEPALADTMEHSTITCS